MPHGIACQTSDEPLALLLMIAAECCESAAVSQTLESEGACKPEEDVQSYPTEP